MCDYTRGIRFCSCNGEKIRKNQAEDSTGSNAEGSRPTKRERYIWQLFRRRVASKDVQTLGLYILPESDLGQGLQADYIAGQLNEGNCFDFEYYPSEGDNLQITKNLSMSPYLSFLYKKGKWVVGNNLNNDIK